MTIEPTTPATMPAIPSPEVGTHVDGKSFSSAPETTETENLIKTAEQSGLNFDEDDAKKPLSMRFETKKPNTELEAEQPPPAPGVAINEDPNATVITATPLAPAPSVTMNDEKTGNELEADPDNPTPNPGDVRSSDKELGPTWLDALLLAIRSGTMLSTNLVEKGINKGNAWYKDHYAEINAAINNFFEPITGKLRNVQTILEAHPELQALVVKSAEDILAELQATLKNETLSEADRTAIMKQIQDLEATLKDAPKLSPPETLEAAEATTTPSPSTAAPTPSSPSTETPEEKAAPEAKAKPPTPEATPLIEPVLEATPTIPSPTTTMPSLSSIPITPMPGPSHVQPSTKPAGQPSPAKGVFQPLIDRLNTTFATLTGYHTNPINSEETPRFGSTTTNPTVTPKLTATRTEDPPLKSRVTPTPDPSTAPTSSTTTTPTGKPIVPPLNLEKLKEGATQIPEITVEPPTRTRTPTSSPRGP
ncbi:MAG: hypothetical protein KBD23_03050 [Gammaproteobacteria bacterium]|nr:hypothetical protein [Gammaproteobacteria bacterium]MBP9729103.1 hypothetical protein [Gammaproteobacteria bacterium]